MLCFVLLVLLVAAAKISTVKEGTSIHSDYLPGSSALVEVKVAGVKVIGTSETKLKQQSPCSNWQ
jgi:hypothetical protein